jgi:hypothetical protein
LSLIVVSYTCNDVVEHQFICAPVHTVRVSLQLFYCVGRNLKLLQADTLL